MVKMLTFVVCMFSVKPTCGGRKEDRVVMEKRRRREGDGVLTPTEDGQIIPKSFNKTKQCCRSNVITFMDVYAAPFSA
jgi:hypothetical protein